MHPPVSRAQIAADIEARRQSAGILARLHIFIIIA